MWGVRPAIHPTASGGNESKHMVRLVAPEPTVVIVAVLEGPQGQTTWLSPEFSF